MIKGVVTDIKSLRHYLAKVDNDRHGVILSKTLNVNVNGTHDLVVANGYIRITVILFFNRRAKRALGLNACRNGHDEIVALNRDLVNYRTVLYGNVENYVKILHFGEFCTVIVVVTEGILLIIVLSSIKTKREAALARRKTHIIVSDVGSHLESDRNDYLTRIEALSALSVRKKDAVCRDLALYRIAKSTNGAHIVELRSATDISGGSFNKVHVDNVGKLAYLTVSNNAERVLERKAAGIYDLNVAHLGVTGLPLIVIENRLSAFILCIDPKTVKVG